MPVRPRISAVVSAATLVAVGLLLSAPATRIPDPYPTELSASQVLHKTHVKSIAAREVFAGRLTLTGAAAVFRWLDNRSRCSPCYSGSIPSDYWVGPPPAEWGDDGPTLVWTLNWVAEVAETECPDRAAEIIARLRAELVAGPGVSGRLPAVSKSGGEWLLATADWYGKWCCQPHSPSPPLHSPVPMLLERPAPAPTDDRSPNPAIVGQ